MAVLLGINPITWTNDDMPELGGDIPLDVCLSEARMAGFAGIELGGKFPRTVSALSPILDRHGLHWSRAGTARAVPSEPPTRRSPLSPITCNCWPGWAAR